jgi:hypothetical protein
LSTFELSDSPISWLKALPSSYFYCTLSSIPLYRINDIDLTIASADSHPAIVSPQVAASSLGY